MPIARKELINLETTPYYHCYNRCVRKGYLFGTHEENKNYDHRKGWLLARLRYLSEGFAIQIAAYAIMDNHYHLVLHVDREQARSWSDEEVNRRWKHALGRKTPFETSFPEDIEKRRDNLCSISRYMGLLNERIARLVNKEDNVSGKFWESRFQSQALLDEGALLAAMAYVELNPIRARMVTTLEESSYTSIQERIQAYHHNQMTPWALMKFQEKEVEGQQLPAMLPFSFKDYALLLDWTGRQMREGKPGYITSDVPPLVLESGLNPTNWIKTVKKSSIREQQILGALSGIKSWAHNLKKRWLKGQKAASWQYLPT